MLKGRSGFAAMAGAGRVSANALLEPDSNAAREIASMDILGMLPPRRAKAHRTTGFRSTPAGQALMSAFHPLRTLPEMAASDPKQTLAACPLSTHPATIWTRRKA